MKQWGSKDIKMGLQHSGSEPGLQNKTTWTRVLALPHCINCVNLGQVTASLYLNFLTYKMMKIAPMSLG